MADLLSQSAGICSKCQEFSNLRRNLCPRCYERWLRSRPIGVGACCAGCGDRRLVHLQYVELRQGFAVVCRNCAAQLEADRLRPVDEEEIRLLLQRDRRSLGDEDRRELWEPGGPGRLDDRRLRLEDRRAPHAYDAAELIVSEQPVPVHLHGPGPGGEPERLPPPPGVAIHQAALLSSAPGVDLDRFAAELPSYDGGAYESFDGADDDLGAPREPTQVTRVHLR